MAANEPPGLSWNVYQRINCLQLIGEGLVAKGDPEEKVPTVQALLRAYRNKELDWNPGLVTYWRKGEQLCQPRPFNWDEYEAIVDAKGDCWSFWVEGVSIYYCRVFCQVNRTDTDVRCSSWKDLDMLYVTRK
jgi:hypothetical protein